MSVSNPETEDIDLDQDGKGGWDGLELWSSGVFFLFFHLFLHLFTLLLFLLYLQYIHFFLAIQPFCLCLFNK